MAKKSILSHIVTIAKTVAPAVVTKRVYDKMFAHRFYCDKLLTFSMSDFPDLTREKHIFYSGKRNKLTGYLYQKEGMEIKGVFIFAHGYGNGGHTTYLDLIHSICMHGYAVFAYDATGYDESEGRSMKGFTQGMIDADHAISYIESLNEEKHFPLYLCGHSWGAYSMSTAIMNHPNVKGLIAFSGFNSATTIFKANGEKYAGKKADEFMVYVDTYEKLLFGDISEVTAVDAFRRTNAKIVIVHSQDDETVPISAGFNIYKKVYGKDPRFKFIRLKENGHGTVYYTLPGKMYYDQVHHDYMKYQKKQKPNEDEKKLYLVAKVDQKKLSGLVDEQLIDKCIKFVEEKQRR